VSTVNERRFAGLRLSRLAIGAALLVVLSLCGILALLRRDQSAKIGEEVRYDDFAFRVLGVRRIDAIGTLAAPVGRELLVVRLEVENKARRVDYELDKHGVRIEDAAGNRTLPDEAWTRALALEAHAPPRPGALHPGETFATDIVFEVPADSTRLRLRIVWGGEFLEGLDELVSGDRTFTLLP
jgi:hypothetical protein